jgi:hypothetical protein
MYAHVWHLCGHAHPPSVQKNALLRNNTNNNSTAVLTSFPSASSVLTQIMATAPAICAGHHAADPIAAATRARHGNKRVSRAPAKRPAAIAGRHYIVWEGGETARVATHLWREQVRVRENQFSNNVGPHLAEARLVDKAALAAHHQRNLALPQTSERGKGKRESESGRERESARARARERETPYYSDCRPSRCTADPIAWLCGPRRLYWFAVPRGLHPLRPNKQ